MERLGQAAARASRPRRRSGQGTRPMPHATCPPVGHGPRSGGGRGLAASESRSCAAALSARVTASDAASPASGRAVRRLTRGSPAHTRRLAFARLARRPPLSRRRRAAATHARLTRARDSDAITGRPHALFPPALPPRIARLSLRAPSNRKQRPSRAAPVPCAHAPTCPPATCSRPPGRADPGPRACAGSAVMVASLRRRVRSSPRRPRSPRASAQCRGPPSLPPPPWPGYATCIQGLGRVLAREGQRLSVSMRCRPRAYQRLATALRARCIRPSQHPPTTIRPCPSPLPCLSDLTHTDMPARWPAPSGGTCRRRSRRACRAPRPPRSAPPIPPPSPPSQKHPYRRRRPAPARCRPAP